MSKLYLRLASIFSSETTCVVAVVDVDIMLVNYTRYAGLWSLKTEKFINYITAIQFQMPQTDELSRHKVKILVLLVLA